jgi:hypothetical protein
MTIDKLLNNNWLEIIIYLGVGLFFLYKGILRNFGNSRRILGVTIFALFWPLAIMFPARPMKDQNNNNKGSIQKEKENEKSKE